MTAKLNEGEKKALLAVHELAAKWLLSFRHCGGAVLVLIQLPNAEDYLEMV